MAPAITPTFAGAVLMGFVLLAFVMSQRLVARANRRNAAALLQAKNEWQKHGAKVLEFYVSSLRGVGPLSAELATSLADMHAEAADRAAEHDLTHIAVVHAGLANRYRKEIQAPAGA